MKYLGIVLTVIALVGFGLAGWTRVELERLRTEVSEAQAGLEGSLLETTGRLAVNWRRALERERQQASDRLTDLTSEHQHWRLELLSQQEMLSDQIQHNGQAVADLIRRSTWLSNDEISQKMILPIVQLRGNGTVGSAVVIASQPTPEGGAKTYLLTAYHVVQEILEGDGAKPGVLESIRFLDPDSLELSDVDHQGRLLAFEECSDVALVLIEHDQVWPYLARLPGQSEQSLEVMDEVCCVGCPLGNKPLPTTGQVSSLVKKVSGATFYMVNAPTFFGNSGGGVFRLDNGQIVGVSSMIYTYGKKQPMVVPHMGLFAPWATVEEFLRNEGYSSILDDRRCGTSMGDESYELGAHPNEKRDG